MLQPLVRRTWAPRGETPIHYRWSDHHRLSVIGALTLAPHRCRIGLYFAIHQKNICAQEVVTFLRSLRKSIRGKMTLIMDRWKVHRAKRLWRFLKKHSKTIQVEWLPPYAPELNPVEQVWNHSKYSDLANFTPEDLEELDRWVRSSIAGTQNQTHLLRSFFRKAELLL